MARIHQNEGWAANFKLLSIVYPPDSLGIQSKDAFGEACAKEGIACKAIAEADAKKAQGAWVFLVGGLSPYKLRQQLPRYGIRITGSRELLMESEAHIGILQSANGMQLIVNTTKFELAGLAVNPFAMGKITAANVRQIQVPARPKLSVSKPYSKAVAYFYNLESDSESGIIEGGLNMPERIRDSVVLNAAQIKEFLTQTTTGSMFNSLAACYIPHYGIVFYDNQQNVVADISVCLLCKKHIQHGFNEVGIDYKAFSAFIEHVGFPVFTSPMEYRKYAESK